MDVEEDLEKDTFNGVENLGGVIDIFRKHGVRSTLFVTGDVLKRYPDFVKRWSNDHEIACHGYRHLALHKIPRNEREEDMNKFLKLYEDLLGGKPSGFRATQHTIDNHQMQLLEKMGFKYDASVIPHYPFFKRNYVGYTGPAPLNPHFPSREDYKRPGDMNILMIPNTGLAFGFPLSGTWLRNFGANFYRTLLMLKKPNLLSFQFHSWDSISCKGSYSKNTGDSFLRFLDTMLKALKKSYNFTSGDQIERDFRNR